MWRMRKVGCVESIRTPAYKLSTAVPLGTIADSGRGLPISDPALPIQLSRISASVRPLAGSRVVIGCLGHGQMRSEFIQGNTYG